MDGLRELLQEIGEACKKATQEREERKSRGEYYNVFNVIGMWSDEMRHSAFIAELLNPKGSHGAGNKFLREFLKRVPAKEPISENYLSVKPGGVNVHKEFYVGERGRIDILADDGEHAIVIENKIYAEDQEGQLRRYHEYAKGSFADHKLIYLTLDGHEPTEYSTGGNKDLEYTCMSYREDIVQWLTECADISSKHNPTLTRVGETIKQYIYLIKQLTNSTMENKQLEEVVEAATATVESTAAAAAILQAGNGIGNTLRERFIFEPLKKLDGFTCEISGFQIKLSKEGWRKWYICIIADVNPWRDMYISVVCGKKASPQKGLKCLNETPDEDNPYGWEWVEIYDWESPASYADMRSEKIANWLIGKIKAIAEEFVPPDPTH